MEAEADTSAGIGPSESYSNIQSSEVDVEGLSMLWEGQQVTDCTEKTTHDVMMFFGFL